MPQAYDIHMTVGTLMTADELLRLPDDGSRYELLRGELRKMSPTGGRHGQIELRIGSSLLQHIEEHGLGAAYGGDTGFRLSRNPDTVRAPDVAFVSAERYVDTAGFIEGPPDVAIEVVSPSDSYTDIEEKTLDWLRAGVKAVVIVDPKLKRVRVHRASETLNVVDVLQIDDVIPGWRLPLAKIFG